MLARFFALVLATTCLHAAAAQEPFRSPGDRPVDVRHLKLELDVDLDGQSVSGTATLDVKTLRSLRTLRLDAVDMEVSGVSLPATKSPLQFENTGTELVVDFGETLPEGSERKIAVAYTLRHPKAGLYFFKPTAAEPKIPTMVWSQGEPGGNRYWIPGIDHPNTRQTTEVVATVPAGYDCISNGKLVSHDKGVSAGKDRFHWLQAKPHAGYLVTLVVGKFAVGKDAWKGVPITYYAPPERAADVARTFGLTTEMVDFFSKRFGIDYPWDKYAQVVVEQFIAGGMENTSATTLTQSAMHDARELLTGSPEGLVSHELGHQWWGDLVTCKDWSHLWLNEGFATYCECLWAEHKHGRDEMQWELWNKSKGARSGRRLSRPIVDRFYADPDTMFDSRAYPKGGWVLHMLRSRLGDDAFFAGLKRYGTDFGYKVAETSDLRMSFERQTGQPLEWFFYDWTERSGHPELTVASSYDAESKLLKVSVRQTQKEAPFHFPFVVEVRCASASAGKPAPVRLQKEVTEREATFYLPLPERPELVRIDPEFTVLSQLTEEKSRDLFVAQLTAATVPERLRAVEYFRKQGGDDDRDRLAKVLAGDAFHGVRIEAARALGELKEAAASKVLRKGMDDADARVRQACAEALGGFRDDADALKFVRERIAKGDPAYAVEAALVDALVQLERDVPMEALRKALTKESPTQNIRNAAIRGLAYADSKDGAKLLLEWTARGKPFECRTAALRSLATFVARNDLSSAERATIVKQIAGYLDTESPRLLTSVLAALGAMGRDAKTAQTRVEKISKSHAQKSVREAAAATLKAIHAEAPSADELQRLRLEIESLRGVNRKLEDRLNKVERK